MLFGCISLKKLYKKLIKSQNSAKKCLSFGSFYVQAKKDNQQFYLPPKLIGVQQKQRSLINIILFNEFFHHVKMIESMLDHLSKVSLVVRMKQGIKSNIKSTVNSLIF